MLWFSSNAARGGGTDHFQSLAALRKERGDEKLEEGRSSIPLPTYSFSQNIIEPLSKKILLKQLAFYQPNGASSSGVVPTV